MAARRAAAGILTMALTHPWLPGVLLHLLMTMTILTMTTLTATAPQAMHLLRLPRPRAPRLLDDDVLHALLAHRRPHKARAHRAAACLRGDPQQAAGDTTIASIVMASHSRRKGRAHDPIIPSSHHPIIPSSYHPIIPCTGHHRSGAHHPLLLGRAQRHLDAPPLQAARHLPGPAT